MVHGGRPVVALPLPVAPALVVDPAPVVAPPLAVALLLALAPLELELVVVPRPALPGGGSV